MSHQMEWETMKPSSEWEYQSAPIIHSTPLSSRPAPTSSPNVSAINSDVEAEILILTNRLSQLHL